MDAFDLQQLDELTPLLPPSPHIIDQVTCDSRQVGGERPLFVALPGERVHGHHFLSDAAQRGARYALVEKGWDAPSSSGAMILLPVDSPLQTLQRLAACYRRGQRARIVAIAGSAGKTTLKELLFSILSKKHAVAMSPGSYNSQVGVPLSLFQIESRHSIALIEAGFSLRGEMATLRAMVRPDCGIVTTLTFKHMPSLGGLSVTAREIASLFAAMPPEGWLLAPPHPLLQEALRESPYRIIWQDDARAVERPLPTVSRRQEGDGVSHQLDSGDGDVIALPLLDGAPSWVGDLLCAAAQGAALLDADPAAIVTELTAYRHVAEKSCMWLSSDGVTIITEKVDGQLHSAERALRKLTASPGHGRSALFVCGETPSPAPHSLWNPLLQQYSVDLAMTPAHSAIDHPQGRSYHSVDEAMEQLRQQLCPGDRLLVAHGGELPLEPLIQGLDLDSGPTQCTINLAALEWNIGQLRALLPTGCRIMPMVKARAYGSDSGIVVRFLEQQGVDIFGLATVDEAVALRRGGSGADLFVLHATPAEADRLVRWRLQPALSSVEQCDAFAAAAERLSVPLKVHLHVDTGMCRFGCRVEEALALARRCAGRRQLILEGLMTHLSCAEDSDDDAHTARQLQLFDEVTAQLDKEGLSPRWRHAANSSALLRHPASHYDMVRVGLALWGLYNSPSTQTLLLQPAVTLTTRIAHINSLRGGETLGYGACYRARRPHEKIAVLPIGYHDGLTRQPAAGAAVLVRGQPAPIVGRVCMDFAMVDVTDIDGAAVGDDVLLFGKDAFSNESRPELFAAATYSCAHELLACLGPRVRRLFAYDDAFALR